MDMKKNCRIPECGPGPDPAAQRLIVGRKQLKKALLNGSVRHVYLAENADPAILEPLEEMCRERNIHITWIRSMAELGSACGIEVGAAAAAAVD